MYKLLVGCGCPDPSMNGTDLLANGVTSIKHLYPVEVTLMENCAKARASGLRPSVNFLKPKQLLC